MDGSQRSIAVTVVAHNSVAEMDHAQELQRREIEIRVEPLVSNQELEPDLCVIDDKIFELFKGLFLEMVDVEEGLKQLNHCSMIFDAEHHHR